MRTFVFGLCSAAWMSLIFCLSSLPGDQLGPDTLIVNVIKKGGHCILFGVLAALYLYTLKGRRPLRETGAGIFLMSLLLALLYAVSDEYHQSFTPGRHSSGKDVVIDACGALMFLGLLYFVENRKKTKTQRGRLPWKSC